MELVDFCNARLDEEINNAVNARGAADGLWTGSHGEVSSPMGYIISAPGEDFLDRRIVDHLVHWQPEHTLINLTLQRKIAFQPWEVTQTRRPRILPRMSGNQRAPRSTVRRSLSRR